MARLDSIIAAAMREIENPKPPPPLPTDDEVADKVESMWHDGFIPTPEAVEPIRNFMAGHGLLLHGPTGSGKTFLLQSLYAKIIPVRQITDYGPEVSVWFEASDGYPLCIDDLGTEPVSTSYGWRDDLMRYVIAHRLDRQKARTHITTNLDAAALAARYGDRTVSRMMGGMKTFELSARHWRG